MTKKYAGSLMALTSLKDIQSTPIVTNFEISSTTTTTF